MSEDEIQKIVNEVSRHFRTFGAGKGVFGNPHSEPGFNSSPQFGGGVDVNAVVRFVLERAQV